MSKRSTPITSPRTVPRGWTIAECDYHPDTDLWRVTLAAMDGAGTVSGSGRMVEDAVWRRL